MIISHKGEGFFLKYYEMWATKMRIRTTSQYWLHKRLTNGINEKEQEEILEKIQKPKLKIP